MEGTMEEMRRWLRTCNNCGIDMEEVKELCYPCKWITTRPPKEAKEMLANRRWQLRFQKEEVKDGKG